MVFDQHTLLLLVGLINASLISCLLLFRRHNRTAHRFLAALVLVLVARVLFYVLGRDGIYDPHSWLYQPPIEFSLAYGPLIYAYVSSLCGRQLQAYWRHFIPVAIQTSYYVVLLQLPATQAVPWIQQFHFPVVMWLESALLTTSMAWYLWQSWHCYSAQQNNLSEQRSDLENFRLPWVFGFLLATSITMGIIVCYTLLAAWLEFTYTQHFWLFACQSLLLFYVAIESWKYGDLRIPKPIQLDQPATTSDSTEVDRLRLKAEAWLQIIKNNRWWQNPEFSLDELAKKLHSNTTTVSKTLNTGLNKNFNTLINELRVTAICQRIDQGLDDGMLLKTALSMGFNSKNSFNRNFKQITGHTPQQYQKRQVPNHKLCQ